MNSTEETKRKNSMILIWQLTIKSVILGEIILDKNLNETERAKFYAEEQYKKIWETRPNKNQTPEEQANEQQFEFLEYLKYVIQTGNLEKTEP